MLNRFHLLIICYLLLKCLIEVGGKPLLKGAGPCEIEEGDEARSDREHDAKKARASRYSDEFHDAFQIASDFGTLTLSLAKVKWKLQRKEELGE